MDLKSIRKLVGECCQRRSNGRLPRQEFSLNSNNLVAPGAGDLHRHDGASLTLLILGSAFTFAVMLQILVGFLK